MDPENSRGNRGRLLGLVECSGININLELIREGHSYFDTRFSRPLNYVLYARQEAQAFNSRRGIWSSLDSRKAYLKRLRDEGKTVYSPKNHLFWAEPRESLILKPVQYKGLFFQGSGASGENPRVEPGSPTDLPEKPQSEAGTACHHF